MSYFGTKADAKKDAEAADMQIDSLMTTSPVRDGGSSAGAAPMEGKGEFTKERTRTRFVGNQGGMRREFPTEGVGGKKSE
jgi:hypothetical protein